MADLGTPPNAGYFSVTPLGCGGLRMSLISSRYDVTGLHQSP